MKTDQRTHEAPKVRLTRWLIAVGLVPLLPLLVLLLPAVLIDDNAARVYILGYVTIGLVPIAWVTIPLYRLLCLRWAFLKSVDSHMVAAILVAVIPSLSFWPILVLTLPIAMCLGHLVWLAFNYTPKRMRDRSTCRIS